MLALGWVDRNATRILATPGDRTGRPSPARGEPVPANSGLGPVNLTAFAGAPSHARLPQFYINGAWVDPVAPNSIDVINPATESAAGRISMGSAADVDRAVKAARAAFAGYSQTSVDERVALLERIIVEYQKRYADMAAAITEEMGAPAMLAQKAQAAMGTGHLQSALAVLKTYAFQELRGSTLLVKEPIGVCGLITPWNWPVNQIACKVAPALAVGCTMVLKPSEIAPFSAQIWTEVLHAAGVPAGVFNLVNGDGATVGAAIASHPGWTWCPSPAPPAPASKWRATPRPR